MNSEIKYGIVALLIVSVLITMIGCSPSPKATYQTISAKEAKKIMDSGEPYVLVDVRTQAEYDEKHIEGAILIPNETIGNQPVELLPDKKATTLVYCRSGNRSKQAAEKLAALGYTNVLDFGGIIDWPY